MKQSREALKAELRTRMEAALDSLLAWMDDNPAPTLTQIEDEVLRRRREVGLAMIEGVINAQESVQPAPGPRCARCGEEMRLKGRKRKGVQTRAGDAEMQRNHYYCPHCQEGFFPPR